MRWVRGLRRRAKRLAGYVVHEVEVPVRPVVTLAERHLDRLLVLPAAGTFVHAYIVASPHWWFRKHCAARIEIGRAGRGSRIAWKLLPSGQGPDSVRSTGAMLAAFVGLVGLSVAGAAIAAPIGAVVFLTGALFMASPTLLFAFTSGGFGAAQRRQRAFKEELERRLQVILRSAQDLERAEGGLSLAESDHRGRLTLTEPDEPSE